MEPFIGQIMLFAGSFAPRGFALCDGQLLEIMTHSALFSILGTTYGGDGKTTFALPDLRSRVPMHPGQGHGLSEINLGQRVGNESVTLSVEQMPKHSHGVNAGGTGDQGTATNHFLAAQAREQIGRYTTSKSTKMNPHMIEGAGGSQPVDVRQPALGLNYCIALNGIYPARG